MKRFLMLLAVAAVAGGMYVAAAPGRSLHAGPSWKQYTTLQKEVTTLKTQLGQVKKTANYAAGFIGACFLSTKAGVAPVNEFGDGSATPTFGYAYVPQGGSIASPSFTTALDIDGSATPGAYFQAVDPSCVGPASAAAQKNAGTGHLMLRAEHTP